MSAVRFDILYALIAFCFVAAVTPGPNNLMLMASGVNFGLRRTIPHLMGVVLGFAFMVAVVGAGLDVVFARFPALLPAMRYVGAAYMLWLAAKLALSGPLSDSSGAKRPLGFFGAAAFQWVNPKGWVMAVSALTTYAVAADYSQSVLIVALVYGLVALPSSGSWAVFGNAMRRILAEARFVRPFNIVMALLLVASIAPVLYEG